MDKPLPRFDLDLLHTFVRIAEIGSLTAAAKQLHRSQSAISEQVHKLEAFCGLPLLTRGKKGASLTPAGERLLPHARNLLLQNDIARQHMHNALLSGDLRLAITDYFRPADIAGILQRLRQQYPHLRLHVAIRKSADIEHEASAGEFDIGLSMHLHSHGPLRDDPSYRRRALRQEPLTWVAHPSVTLTPGEPIPLLALPDTCAMQQYVIRLLQQHRIPYYLAHTASGIGGLHAALSAGLGITCLNTSALPADVTRLSPSTKLPPLTEVTFHLLVAQRSHANVWQDVERVLVEQL